MTETAVVPIARKEVTAMPLLAGNLAAATVLAIVAATATRSSEPIIDVATTFVSIAAAFIVPITLFLELPLLRSLRSRMHGKALVEELGALAIGGAVLAIPGGLIAVVVNALQPDFGYGWTFESSFLVGALGFGFVGIWCSLLGRATYEATRRSKALSAVVLTAFALAVVWSLLLLAR